MGPIFTLPLPVSVSTSECGGQNFVRGGSTLTPTGTSNTAYTYIPIFNAYILLHAYQYQYIHTKTHTYIPIPIHTYQYINVYILLHAYQYQYIHTKTHTYIPIPIAYIHCTYSITNTYILVHAYQNTDTNTNTCIPIHYTHQYVRYIPMNWIHWVNQQLMSAVALSHIARHMHVNGPVKAPVGGGLSPPTGPGAVTKDLLPRLDPAETRDEDRESDGVAIPSVATFNRAVMPIAPSR